MIYFNFIVDQEAAKIDSFVEYYVILMAVFAPLNVYVSYDIKFIMSIRSDNYKNKDLSLLFLNLFTDIGYRFWVDMKQYIALRKKRKEQPIEENEYNENPDYKY